MKKVILSICILAAASQYANAQSGAQKRADKYFGKAQYVRAAEIYEKEVKENKSLDLLEKLGDCYYYNGKTNNAAKYYAQALELYPEQVDAEHLHRYAMALKGNKDYAKADKILQKYNAKTGKTQTVPNTLAYFEKKEKSERRPYIVTNSSISTKDSEWGAAFNANQIVFSSSRDGGVSGKKYKWNNENYLDLFVAEVDEEGDASGAVAFSKEINSAAHEGGVTFSGDGNTMYFSRNVKPKNRKGDKISHMKIFKSSKVGGEWSKAIEVSFNKEGYSAAHPALNKNNTKLYFASDMPGTQGNWDIFVVDINKDGSFGEPKNLGPNVNTVNREQFPFVSDEDNLYFSSNGHITLGGLDVFKSEINGNSYSKAENLGNVINSNKDDFGFIYDEATEKGFLSSNRAGGKGSDDIYRVDRKQIYFVEGVAQDSKTGELLPGTDVVMYDNAGREIAKTTVGADGAFVFEIQPTSDYKLTGSKLTYDPAEVEFASGKKGNIEQNIVLELIPVVPFVTLDANPIYFEFDKAILVEDSKTELDRIINFMKEHKTFRVEVASHTDKRGSDKYNMSLSARRANAVKDYFVEQGIAEDRLVSVGYGESQPKVDCKKCSDEEHALNRRSEFTLIK
ncbi:OmpA family protein [Aureivirga sp. CE67]|uniref:OmpA family protein n=1 Tax=Aureivirga sp. CE67 TaxID=1788983 RepID=UPI0018CBB5DB|nr:OmpA family protein [Aureivirga sp. CE67]